MNDPSDELDELPRIEPLEERQPSEPETGPKFQSTLAHLLVVTACALWLFVGYWFEGFGFLLALVGVILFLTIKTRGRIAKGVVIGLVGGNLYFLFDVLETPRFDTSDPHFWVDVAYSGAFVGTIGACIHAIVLGHRELGWWMLIIVVLLVVGSGLLLPAVH